MNRTARGRGRIPFGESVAAIASLWAMNWDSYRDIGIRPGLGMARNTAR
jgi:hypothetical protein